MIAHVLRVRVDRGELPRVGHVGIDAFLVHDGLIIPAELHIGIVIHDFLRVIDQTCDDVVVRLDGDDLPLDVLEVRPIGLGEFALSLKDLVDVVHVREPESRLQFAHPGEPIALKDEIHERLLLREDHPALSGRDELAPGEREDAMGHRRVPFRSEGLRAIDPRGRDIFVVPRVFHRIDIAERVNGTADLVVVRLDVPEIREVGLPVDVRDRNHVTDACTNGPGA